ncbi:recombinase family protein [Mycobacterium pseudokansasii]|uniref:recombinase family protein n=1 Tax=Mycobacterium pseudokansasii TaxID=2341080 RepID=UPI0007BE6194|nr:recombinase family protein [Mycobacterium pseudokansasii]KZS65574.1 hypothetical protein A4G27_05435 [Mycobacterium kansasii]VAZ98608.1 hypothetical protein LAUMK35_04058 [Mycobacterium pseudokansasii]VBA29757.1 hypothetical protein LAUMK21_04054 [Mycobacterium pseudokansasii]
MNAPKTAIYLRQSKDRDGNELAVHRQRDACLKLCREKKWHNTAQYIDNDRSASNGKRREDYQRMLTDIAAGRIGRVVVWDLDRLHRQPIELEHFMKLADDKHLALATVTGDVDLATDNGRLFARIKGAVGMAEVERKSARQKAAAEQLATTQVKVQGNEGARAWWAHRPFGYDADRDGDGKWWVYDVKRDRHNPIHKHPKESALLAEAYQEFNRGTALGTVAARWNKAGVTTPQGKPWSGTRVREVLLLARNAGLREYGGQLVIDKEGEAVKGAWPAIVTKEVWQAAREKINSNRGGPYRGRKYLLSGIARCGREGCGAALTSHISARGKLQYACLRCHKVSRSADKLDELIVAAVVGRLSRDDAVELLRPAVEEVDATALREQRRALHARLAQLGKDFVSAPPEFTQAALADINAKLADIDATLNDPGKAAVFEDVIGAPDVERAFNGLDLGRRRTIVDALMSITVNPVGKGTGGVWNPEAIDVAWRS